MSPNVTKIQAIHVRWNTSEVVDLDPSDSIFALTPLAKAKLLGVELVMKKVETSDKVDKEDMEWILRLAEDPDTDQLPKEWKDYSGHFTIARKDKKPFTDIDPVTNYLRERNKKEDLNQSVYEAWLKETDGQQWETL